MKNVIMKMRNVALAPNLNKIQLSKSTKKYIKVKQNIYRPIKNY